MLSWPDIYIPPIDQGTTFKPLTLLSHYSKVRVRLDSALPKSLYVCGITPYDSTHLGHAATYLTFDLIHRYLVASGNRVAFTENITDIDDPLIERAKRDGGDWQELARDQINLFRSDMTALRVLPPRDFIGVVESIPELIKKILIMEGLKKTYRVAGDLYLSLLDVEGAIENLPCSLDKAIEIFAERGGDPARVGKKHPLDPLLWSLQKPGEPGWDSPFGIGRPGWHIECATIALDSLDGFNGSDEYSITIQGGGSDLFFPHHYMSALHSQVLTEKPFAEVYVHAGMIGLNGEKMSKSKGNLVFVSRLLSDGVDPMAIRLALMEDPYASDRMWSDQRLIDSNNFLERLRSSLAREEVAPTATLIHEIAAAIADDLDMKKVFALLRKWCTDCEAGSSGGQAGALSRALDTLCGLAL